MTCVKFFLDTNALICLDGLKGSVLQDFKNRIDESNSELSTTHVQVDEWKLRREQRDYRRKVEEALASLKNKGIVIKVELTKGFVIGVSRIGFGRISGEETGKVYDELRKEIDECEKAEGRTKTLLNIARDATIAISSLDHDFFITCDRCLSDSWCKVIGKYKMLRQRFKIPRVIYAIRNPSAVTKRILGLLP